MTTKSTKLLFYVPGLTDGGGERLWAVLATAFHTRGHEVVFAQDFAAEDNRHTLHVDIPVHTLGPGHIKSVRRLSDLLKNSRPDIALSAIGGSNIKLIAARALSRTPTKVIQTFHGHKEWTNGWLSYATARALPLTSRITACTVAVSEHLRTELISTWGAVSARTTFIPNPVLFPKPEPQPTQSDLTKRAPVILAVGRLVADKDYPTLLAAFANLKQRKASLVILGKGPEQARIEAIIDELGLSARVTLAGYVREPWPFYEKATCLALTSRSESFGNVIVEALSFGLPVVATACDGAKHIITSPKLGQLVEIGDIEALRSALDGFLSDPGNPAPRLSRAQDFSLAARLPAYQTLIDEIMNAPVSDSNPDAAKSSI